MPIQILPPQLANQIAAGEVVERPASVVKELVENSLDAQASHIDIDIEKGGSKLIRVRDNGSGIAEQELVLALSRHATSKITDLHDLEAISSLGFRGEALASISSVSRLTLTSCTAGQEAAWQANAEGRDMQVSVRPAAHPVGTSIEVLDLFFNTPARRKFLRSDKTEFGHIDELLKRLALSRYDVSWQLNHNGQTVRRLKAATTDEQRLKRVAALCGRTFAEHAAFIENQYGDVRIWGWIVHPAACSAQLQCQYSYVNGRMMRDKLLNHAIRQAYGDSLLADQQPAFVLYIELDPRQVDVNVHPAKHEVRFHQARLIHDFVVSALNDALTQLNPLAFGVDAVSNHDAAVHAVREHSAQSYRPSSQYSYQPQHNSAAAVKRELGYWQQSHGVETPVGSETANACEITAPASNHNSAGQSGTVGKLIAQNRYLLQQHMEQIVVIDLVPTLAAYVAAQPQSATAILLPQRISVNATQVKQLTQQAELLSQAGFDLLLADQLLIVRAVPAWLRHSVLSHWLPLWLDAIRSHERQNLIVSLLSMLLNANGVTADTLLKSVPGMLSAPQHWVYVPLQLDASLSALAEMA
ncbi:DNA mismatch repair endonuclease MutL [Rheinheimera maricola]|uniref:DNA mismatch repair protein MutL n=1 Tax=Rheinheimera maricola TaxID=2793282 RepID=A0ABS7XAB0_9GAMM|nr:DNA mismatch repair endonuclease MutL [Rheinheimera maricola]MBZ9612484.1 DNA mismatch repair endonuclease MutL [Rheinheimera maricola]